MPEHLDWLPGIIGKTIARSYTVADDGKIKHVIEFTDGGSWVSRSIGDGLGRANVVYPAGERLEYRVVSDAQWWALNECSDR